MATCIMCCNIRKISWFLQANAGKNDKYARIIFYLQKLTVSHIEDIHTLLTNNLSVDRGIRHRRVGITGTNYRTVTVQRLETIT